jgi:hypothetical protein
VWLYRCWFPALAWVLSLGYYSYPFYDDSSPAVRRKKQWTPFLFFRSPYRSAAVHGIEKC